VSNKTIYRNAAALAAIQLDRPFTAQDIARIEACIIQAKITGDTNNVGCYLDLATLTSIIGNLGTDTYKPLSPLATIEEALDDAGKRLAQAFAPRMPSVDDSPLNT
jgi:hypothetical protein